MATQGRNMLAFSIVLVFMFLAYQAYQSKEGMRVETGWALLPPAQQETPQYAVYSYLLLRGATTSDNRERYLAVIRAWMEESSEMIKLRRSAQPAELNIAYIPVSRTLPVRTPEFVLKYYDRERARLLLRVIPDATRDGPYIVSYDRPLSQIDRELRRGEFLRQDLTGFPENLMRVWVKEFMRQAGQPGAFAKEDPWRQFVLQLRTGIEIAAGGATDVEKAWGEAKEKWAEAVEPAQSNRSTSDRK